MMEQAVVAPRALLQYSIAVIFRCLTGVLHAYLSVPCALPACCALQTIEQYVFLYKALIDDLAGRIKDASEGSNGSD
jgi:hypothetical protein